MDVERIVFRLIADATSYFNVLDSAQSRLLFFASFMTQHMTRSALRMAAEFEQAAISFEVMTGSATAARDILADLQKIALETPFTFSEVLRSAQQVKAFGFDVAEITTVISRLGDVAAGTGTDISRIILAFGQVRTTGRLMGQELRQFSNAGVPILEMLSQVTGQAVSAIPQLVRQGRISFADVARAFNLMTNEGGLFANMMQRVSRETIGGRWQNFVESLSLASRRWAEMALGVFHVKDALNSLGEFFQGQATDEAIAGWRDRFDQVRASLVLTGQAVGAAWAAVVEGVSSAGAALVRFYEENKTLIRSVALLVAGWYAIKAAVFLVGLGGAALIGTLNTIWRVLFVIHQTVKAIVGLSLVLRSAAVFVSAWAKAAIIFTTLLNTLGLLLSPVGLILVGIGATLFQILKDGRLINMVFDGVAEAFQRLFQVGQLMFGDFKNAWDGIVAAVRGGDMALAFEIAVEGMKLAWRSLIHHMEGEWRAFSIRFGLAIEEQIMEHIEQPVRAFFANIAELIGWQSQADRIRQLGREFQQGFEVHRQNRRAQAEALVPDPAATAAYMRSLPEYRRLQELTTQGQVVGLLGRDVRDLVREIRAERQRTHPLGIRDEGRVIPSLIEPAPGLQALLGPAAQGVSNVHQQLRETLVMETSILELWLENMRNGVQDAILRAVPTQANIDRQTARVRTAYEELDRYTQSVTASGQAAAAARRQLSTPPQVSHGAEVAARELSRIFGEGGTSPLEHFLTRMQHVEEAFRGPEHPDLVGGAVGAAAVLGVRTVGGLINEQMRDFGLARAYAEFQRTIPNEQDRRPGAAMQGSREAQDIINRAQGQQLTVQEQIRAEIAVGNALAQEQANHSAQVVAVLRGMAAQQGGKILGVRVDGGGGE